MGATRQPYMYEAVTKAPFDPKAVTRASYESKKPKPKPNGPLVSFNRHPDAHMIPSGRSRYIAMSRRTKSWIKGMRVVQLGLRVLEVVAAIGLVVVMSISGLIGWVLGVTLGVVILHCAYSIYHHAHSAGSRTPGSSAAYQVFSGISDLCVLPLYAYGAFQTRSKSEEWQSTNLAGTNVMKYEVPSVYYGLIAAGGLHVVSLAISLWLGVMFRRISMMPPDMNPLEANLTSRAHKRNKSSVATTVSSYSDEKLDAQLDEVSSRPPSVPFMHTRQGSATSFNSRDSRIDLPSRQYQVAHSNRSSVTSQDLKRMSAPPTANRAAYMEIPLSETTGSGSPLRPTSMYSTPEGRLSSGSVPSYRAETVQAAQTAQPRSAKFTETWYASESLISRTQQRNRLTKQPKGPATAATSSPQRNSRPAAAAAYESVRQTLDASDSEDDNENSNYYSSAESPNHPNPLRSHPLPSQPQPQSPSQPRRPKTPFSRLRASVLSEISLNDRRVSGDITDSPQFSQQQTQGDKLPVPPPHRQRLSSIQPESEFYAKPYGELKAATPPIFIGGGSGGEGSDRNRQVSSGNDYGSYDLGLGGRRRDVSGKVAEEGRSRYSVLNEY